MRTRPRRFPSTIRDNFHQSPFPSTWRRTPRWGGDHPHRQPCDGAEFAGQRAGRFPRHGGFVQDSLSNEGLLILAALVAVYIVLGVLYESFIHPITILSTLPSAGVGALLARMLFQQDLNVVAIIGFFLLIGIVKKNGIMMVDFALEGEREGA